MTTQIDLMMKFKLTPAMGRGLLMLLENKIVTYAMLENAEKAVTTDGKVLMHRIRRRMAGTGIVINAQRSVGYWMNQASKDRILELMRTDEPFVFPADRNANSDEQLSLPLDHGGNGDEPEAVAA